MTVHVSIEEASAHLPNLAKQALGGEDIIIDLDREGTEQIRLVPTNQKVIANPRIPGIDEGKLIVPDDFNDPLPVDLQKAFEGNQA